MRFSILDRVFVVIMVIVMIAVSGFAVIVCWQRGWGDLLWLCLAAAACLAIGIRLVYCACAHTGDAARGSQTITLSQGEGGSVSVTLATMNAIVERTVQALEGVQSAKPSFQNREDGLYLKIQTVLDEQVVIPAKGEEIRTDVTKALADLTGVTLKQIDIMAEHAAAQIKK